MLGGMAIHEDDKLRLQRELGQLVINHLGAVPLNLDEFEIHAAEMRDAKCEEKPVDYPEFQHLG